jgi:hypothetical protein
VRFQILTEARMKMTVFWDVVPFSFVESEQSFRGSYCLQHQDFALMMEVVSTSEI